ncbi:Lysosomal-trafficking regulator [Manis javanica]|nr:Lysosomal-trafficking regulator [Manis javanica]
MTTVATVADRLWRQGQDGFAFAELFNQEALALQADGVDIIQFDEPAFNVYMKDAADWGVQALERAAAGLTQVDGRAYLLRLRDQGQYGLEEHAGRGMAPVPRRCFRAGQGAASTRRPGRQQDQHADHAVEGMSFDTPKGQMTFRKEDHQALQSMYHFKIRVDPALAWGVPELVREIKPEEMQVPIRNGR